MHPWQDRFPRLWAFGEILYVLFASTVTFILFCLPVVTVPAAVVGLFASAGELGRGRVNNVFSEFWQAFRATFWTATAAGLLHAALLTLLLGGSRTLLAAPHWFLNLSGWIWTGLALIQLLTLVFLAPLLAWYPQGFRTAMKRSFLLAAAHPLTAVASLLAALVLAWVLFLFPPVLAAVGPGLLAGLLGFGAWRVMKRYAPAEE